MPWLKIPEVSNPETLTAAFRCMNRSKWLDFNKQNTEIVKVLFLLKPFVTQTFFKNKLTGTGSNIITRKQLEEIWNNQMTLQWYLMNKHEKMSLVSCDRKKLIGVVRHVARHGVFENVSKFQESWKLNYCKWTVGRACCFDIWFSLSNRLDIK